MMKKLLSFLIASVAMLMLASCGGANASSNSEKDSSEIAEVTEEPEEAPQLLVTPDLTLLEVKGNVKEINGKQAGDYVYGNNALFDSEGHLTHYGNSDPIDKISEVKRDSDGRLTSFLASEWVTVKWDSEKPISLRLSINEYSCTESYKYDNELVNEISVLSEDLMEETQTTAIGKVTYPEDGFDKNGNWIKRTVKYPDHTETHVREIVYY